MTIYDWETCFVSVHYAGAKLQTTTHIINLYGLKKVKIFEKGLKCWKVLYPSVPLYPFLNTWNNSG